MIQLNLPEYQFNTRKNKRDKLDIFDPFRKKYAALTPEEWVRQNVARFLVEEKRYPASLIAVELPLKLNKMTKRADIVLYDTNGKPMLLVECKAPNVKISQDVFDQAARYNLVFKVPYLLITNGMNHYCSFVDQNEKKCRFLTDIPTYEEIQSK